MRTVLRGAPLATRFYALADRSAGPDACHPWRGFIDSDGYGRLHQKRDTYLAHRLAWELENGQEFPQVMVALHSCDRRDCVNPLHVRPGSIADNNHDAVRKRRHALGERSGHARLSEASVLELRRRAMEGRLNFEKVGRELGVSGRAVAYAVKGRNWKHLAQVAT